jgi:hypothetical protein
MGRACYDAGRRALDIRPHDESIVIAPAVPTPAEETPSE